MIFLNQYNIKPNALEDKIIAITGAGDGIGKVIAKHYAALGATVILIGRTVEKLEAVYDEIEHAGYPQAAIVPIDFAEATEENYQVLVNSIEVAFGRLDGLVHNAAELGDRTSISNYKAAVWNTVMAVNVTAPFLLTKALLHLLKKSKNSAILFTGSSVGYQGRAYWGAYAVSKAANENLMQILADELGETSNVRVNSINPGATRTNMRATAYPAENPETVKDANDLLPLYCYLISDDSIAVNGQQFDFTQLSQQTVS